MKSVAILTIIGMMGTAHAQEPSVTPQDQYTILAIFAIAVAAVFVYLARNVILRKKTDYDMQDLGSKKDTVYEKYHSDWNDDFEELGSRTRHEPFNVTDVENLPDLYDIMKIQSDATQDQIKNQYKRLAKEMHPDRSSQKDAKEKMSRLNQAYDILSDPRQRKQYDKCRS